MDEAALRGSSVNKIGLVGIGAMTRMVAKAYRMADAVRAAGVPVVMGGPHVTEVPDEALRPRWRASPRGCRRARRSGRNLAQDRRRRRARPTKEIYTPVDAVGQGAQAPAPALSRDSMGTMDLDQFNLVPKACRAVAEARGRRMGNVSHRPG